MLKSLLEGLHVDFRRASGNISNPATDKWLRFLWFLNIKEHLNLSNTQFQIPQHLMFMITQIGNPVDIHLRPGYYGAVFFMRRSGFVIFFPSFFVSRPYAL